jgi:hypothetical protein
MKQLIGVLPQIITGPNAYACKRGENMNCILFFLNLDPYSDGSLVEWRRTYFHTYLYGSVVYYVIAFIGPKDILGYNYNIFCVTMKHVSCNSSFNLGLARSLRDSTGIQINSITYYDPFHSLVELF